MNNTTILVVDDEPQIRRVLRATLSSYGYDAVEAKDGQEAVEMVIRERPALILMDVNMPGMNGLEACRKIRLFILQQSQSRILRRRASTTGGRIA